MRRSSSRGPRSGRSGRGSGCGRASSRSTPWAPPRWTWRSTATPSPRSALSPAPRAFRATTEEELSMIDDSRHPFGKLVLALPAALAAPVPAEEKPPELAELLAGREPGLSEDERKRLAKGIGETLKPLKAVRDFKLPENADPAFRFRAE